MRDVGVQQRVVAAEHGQLSYRWARPDDAELVFGDVLRARAWLRGRAAHPGAFTTLRRAVAALSVAARPAARADVDVLEEAARALARGAMRAVVAADLIPTAPPRIEAEEVPAARSALAWIEVAVVWDADDAPVSGVEVTVALPTGEARTVRTAGDGVARIDGIPAGGCRVTGGGIGGLRRPSALHVAGLGDAPIGDAVTSSSASVASSTRDRPPAGPLRLARVEAHRVRTGETLAGIAKAAGMTWQDLAKFNWDTADPKRINERLRAEVGCTKRTHDRKNYLLDDGDHPGLLFVPHPWEGATCATRDRHTIRVLQRRFVHVIYDQHRRFPLPFHEYLLYDGERHVATGESDEHGRVMLESVPAHWHVEVIGPGPSHPLWNQEGDGGAPAKDPADSHAEYLDDGLEEEFEALDLQPIGDAS